ncbi:hypothetical protein Mal15_04680 [Stieleria maiorica]|uniref:Uncharacterized protein n=2 Tax=Stieleria maiorica TaxID=2795974 RepID=A0A5B9M8T9_9BACT|nr:hypothetical protein Mal15_04680 [Stieleria maiorica]
MEHRGPTLRLVERYLRESRMVKEEVIDQEAERVVAQVERTLGNCDKVTASEFKRSALRLAAERMDAIATGVLPSVVPVETPAAMAEAEEVRAVCWLRPRFWSGLATQRFTQSGIARVGSSVRPSLTDE